MSPLLTILLWRCCLAVAAVIARTDPPAGAGSADSSSSS